MSWPLGRAQTRRTCSTRSIPTRRPTCSRRCSWARSTAAKRPRRRPSSVRSRPSSSARASSRRRTFTSRSRSSSIWRCSRAPWRSLQGSGATPARCSALPSLRSSGSSAGGSRTTSSTTRSLRTGNTATGWGSFSETCSRASRSRGGRPSTTPTTRSPTSWRACARATRTSTRCRFWLGPTRSSKATSSAGSLRSLSSSSICCSSPCSALRGPRGCSRASSTWRSSPSSSISDDSRSSLSPCTTRTWPPSLFRS
eukprot:Amastigsp_a73_2543.p3 type:complete len:254 gc:universal Amastigsp_a73_2543:1155-394(-)